MNKYTRDYDLVTNYVILLVEHAESIIISTHEVSVCVECSKMYGKCTSSAV